MQLKRQNKFFAQVIGWQHKNAKHCSDNHDGLLAADKKTVLLGESYEMPPLCTKDKHYQIIDIGTKGSGTDTVDCLMYSESDVVVSAYTKSKLGN